MTEFKRNAYFIIIFCTQLPFFTPFLADSDKFLYHTWRLHFWTDGILSGAEAMTEVRKPGCHGKQASMLLISNSKIKSSTLYRFSKNTSHYFSNLISIFLSATVRNSSSFFY